MKLLTTRRQFIGTLGHALGCAALGVNASEVWAFSAPRDLERLRFGALDPLVDLLQESTPDDVLPVLVSKLRAGLALSDLVAATALANTRAFGGTHYDGYHALMALMPAYEMALERSGPLTALPVLKVVQRTVRFLHENGRSRQDVLTPVADTAQPGELHAQMRVRDLSGAERTLTELVQRSPLEAYEQLQDLVRQDIDVHRVVLSWRAFDLLRVAGAEQAASLLRQQLHFCANSAREREQRGQAGAEVATLVPALLTEYRLDARERGTLRADDEWITALAETCFATDRKRAAVAVAHALAQGIDGADIGCALALTASTLLLHDQGRTREAPGKPIGSVHGASVGVHAADAANAWRHIAAIGSAAHAHATWIAAAYHTAGQAQDVGPEAFDHELPANSASEPEQLRVSIESAIHERNQALACKAARRYLELGLPTEPLFSMLHEVMLSEDGALHAEKYYCTVREEYASARPAHRDQHLLALVRVAASTYGFPDAGCAQARALLDA